MFYPLRTLAKIRTQLFGLTVFFCLINSKYSLTGDDRGTVVETCQIYYIDFLTRFLYFFAIALKSNFRITYLFQYSFTIDTLSVT